MAAQVTIYLNEADQWHHRPLHMEILNHLRKQNAYAAIAIHAVAGFLGRQRVETSHLVEPEVDCRWSSFSSIPMNM